MEEYRDRANGILCYTSDDLVSIFIKDRLADLTEDEAMRLGKWLCKASRSLLDEGSIEMGE